MTGADLSKSVLGRRVRPAEAVLIAVWAGFASIVVIATLLHQRRLFQAAILPMSAPGLAFAIYRTRRLFLEAKGRSEEPDPPATLVLLALGTAALLAVFAAAWAAG